MRRISPFSRAGFVAWFFVVESVLGYLHLGEFSVRLIGNLFAWMQSNFFVDLFLGLGMLLLLNQWPNIEPHIPAWMRFKPAHERLRDVESHLRTIQGFIGDQPKPNYPQLAIQARISGTVRLAALISADGHIQNLRVVGGHPMLIPAAIETVRQWVYRPTLLNGLPVEVLTDIEVNFVLQ